METNTQVLPLTTREVMRLSGNITRKQFDYLRAQFRSVVDAYLVGKVGRSLLWSTATPLVIGRMRELIRKGK